jgi:hypothetical protein
MGRMVDDCRSAGITAVVLSPFVYGSRYTMRNAISYTNALHELLRAQDVILVDCVRLLAKFSKSSILQHDGFHLSRQGHNVIGEAIAQAIVADVRARKDRAGGTEPHRVMDAGVMAFERPGAGQAADTRIDRRRAACLESHPPFLSRVE